MKRSLGFNFLSGIWKPSLQPAMTSLHVPLSKLTKKQLLEHLSASEVPHHAGMSVLELRELCKQLVAPQTDEFTPLLQGLEKATKEALLKRAHQLDIKLPPQATCGCIILRIKDAITQRRAPQPTDIMGFGKHRDLQYATVLQDFSSYLVFCQRAIKDDKDCCWQMTRFVSWAENRGDATTRANKDVRSKSKGVDRKLDAINCSLSVIMRRLDNLERSPSSTSLSAASFEEVGTL